MTILIVSFCLGIAIAVAILVFKARANKRDGVVMDWEGSRFTRTELIEGYRQNAQRHPLRGLTARVEDTGFHRSGPNQHRIHVIVEGPNTAIVKSARNNEMIKATLLPLLTVPALMVAGVFLSSGVAHASPQSDYVAALREQGAIQDSVSDTMAIEMGNMICQKMSEGVSRGTMVHFMEDTVPGQPMAANEMVDAAVQYLCPWNASS